MPTTRPRVMITETDRIKTAIDLAAKRWPELSDDRAALLRKIVETGVQSLELEAQAKTAKRLSAIRSAAGSLTDVWPTNWRQEMADEWPE